MTSSNSIPFTMKSIVDWLWRSWLFHFPKCVCWSESRFAQMLSEVEFSIASRFRRWRWFYWMKINKLNKFFVFELLESWKFTASHRCACWTNEIFFTKMNRSNFISARWLCKQFTNRFFSKENFPKMNELTEQPVHQFTQKKKIDSYCCSWLPRAPIDTKGCWAPVRLPDEALFTRCFHWPRSWFSRLTLIWFCETRPPLPNWLRISWVRSIFLSLMAMTRKIRLLNTVQIIFLFFKSSRWSNYDYGSRQ